MSPWPRQQPPSPVPTGRSGSYFLWMSVSVTPCSVTLKWTRVGVGSVSSSKVEEMAFWMAGAPASVSMLTELRYKTLHTARTAQSPAQHGARSTPASRCAERVQHRAQRGRVQGRVPGIILQNRTHVHRSDLF